MPVKHNKDSGPVKLNDITTDEHGPKRALDYDKLANPNWDWPQDHRRGSYAAQKNAHGSPGARRYRGPWKGD